MTYPIYKWIQKLSKFLLILNLIDGVSTIIFLIAGKATEANPLMNLLWQFGPVSFISFKLFIVSMGVVLIANYFAKKNPRFALSALILATIPYVMVLFHHLRNL